MAVSQSDLDALESAIASGELRVTVDGRTVEYRSIDDLISAHAFLSRKLSAASEPTTVRRSPLRYQVADFSD
jgi:roadblock/LC7 domain-containing protein